MHVDIDFFNPEHCLLGFQFMDYVVEDPTNNNEVMDQGKALNIGFLFFTIGILF